MKTKIIIAAAASAFLIISIAVFGYLKAVAPLSGNVADKPKIEVAPESYDFGDVKYGDKVDYTFRVKNSGGADLEILKVSTSCGCTTAEISKEKIAPGEEAELRVKFNSAAMGEVGAYGEQKRIIYIKSNDPPSPQKEINIKANVK